LKNHRRESFNRPAVRTRKTIFIDRGRGAEAGFSPPAFAAIFMLPQEASWDYSRGLRKTFGETHPSKPVAKNSGSATPGVDKNGFRSRNGWGRLKTFRR